MDLPTNTVQNSFPGISDADLKSFQTANPGLRFTNEDLQHYNSSVVPTTLNGTDVVKNPQSFQVPQVSNPNNALNNAIAGIATSVSSAQAKDTAAENTSNAGNDSLVTLMKELGGETGDRNTAETAIGLPTMNKDLNDLQTLQTQQLGGYINSINKNNNNAEGHFDTAVSDDEAKISRQHGIDALLTSSLIQAKQGNITAAQATVDRAISAKYDPIKNAINVQNTIIAQNRDNLSRADKKLADEKTMQNNLMLKNIDKQQQDEKDIQDTIQLVASHNAPNSVIALMSKAKSPIEALQIGRAYISDPLARTLQSLQIKKLGQEIKNADLTSKVYIPGAIPAVDAIVQNINSGKSKLSDITGNPALKNLVQQGLAATSTSGPSDVLLTTQQSINELQGMIDKNEGFSGAVGFKGPITTFTGPIPGTQTANFAAKAKQVVNDVVLPNLTYLKGVGRITDREFQALQSSVTSLNVDPKTGVSTLSESEFKKELSNLEKRINDKVSSASSNSSSTTTTMIGPDGNTYNVPNTQVDAFIKAGGKKQ